MSSGFISGGTTDNPIDRDHEWLKAQQEIEATRRRKEEEGKQEGGKSLYEVLQNNKGGNPAKQEAFEESIRLRNQFRSLDEDEVEFLDSVLESTRAKEDAVKQQTTQQLRLFRRQQEEADKASVDEAATRTSTLEKAGDQNNPSTLESQWAVNARKRKRAKDTDILPGVKLRKPSSTNEKPPAELAKTSVRDPTTQAHDSSLPAKDTSQGEHSSRARSVEDIPVQPSPTSPKAGAVGLGLAAYSSDEDEGH
ncbi:MAG: hypothetical protein Q9179_003650 [Wetmoreana sp. 5 TL-2023]